MNDGRQSDLFDDQRETPEPRDRCKCGHECGVHVSEPPNTPMRFVGGLCTFPSCECSQFEPPTAEPQPALGDGDRIAAALNKPEVPGFVGNSSTSRAAAIGQYFKRPSSKRRIFHFIESQGDRGATCDEVEQALAPMRHETVSSTICGLKKAGIVVAGERKRPTRRGFLAEVVIVPPEHRGIVTINADDFKDPATGGGGYCNGRR